MYTFNVRTSPEREYCTQYAVSGFEFAQRLCAEDGIAWDHHHSTGDHLLVFTDDQTWFSKLSDASYQQSSGTVAHRLVIKHFRQSFSTRTSKATRRDYDFERPRLQQEGGFSTDLYPLLETTARQANGE